MKKSLVVLLLVAVLFACASTASAFSETRTEMYCEIHEWLRLIQENLLKEDYQEAMVDLTGLTESVYRICQDLIKEKEYKPELLRVISEVQKAFYTEDPLPSIISARNMASLALFGVLEKDKEIPDICMPPVTDGFDEPEPTPDPHS